MGLSIYSNTSFPDNCPILSGFVAPSNLKFGMRASNADNFFDVSDLKQTVAPVGAIGYSSTGINSGVSGIASVQTSLDNKADDEFTLYATFRINTNGLGTVSKWVAGNYVSASVGGFGISIFLDADPLDAANFRINQRAQITRKKVSDGTFGVVFTDARRIVPLVAGAYPADLGWFVLAFTFKRSTRLMKIKNLLTGEETSLATNDATWLDFDFSGANRNGQPLNVPKMRVLHSGATSNTANLITEPEVFYWDRLLTDAELTEQLTYTRSFMSNARGVTLP